MTTFNDFSIAIYGEALAIYSYKYNRNTTPYDLYTLKNAHRVHRSYFPKIMISQFNNAVLTELYL